jgi:hypothetical protein
MDRRRQEGISQGYYIGETHGRHSGSRITPDLYGLLCLTT